LDLIVLATRNEGKAEELKTLLPGLAARIESLRDHPEVRLPPEHGTAYEENAALKARAVTEALGVPALGDEFGSRSGRASWGARPLLRALRRTRRHGRGEQ